MWPDSPQEVFPQSTTVPVDPGLAHQQEESIPLVQLEVGFDTLREFLIDGQEDSSAELASLLEDLSEPEG